MRMTATSASSRRQRWRAECNRSVDGAGLAVFRILFSTVLLAAVLRFMAKGWIATLYLEPSFFFSYERFEWIRPWPPWGMAVHFGLLVLSAAALIMGLYTRLAALAFCLLFTYVELIDKATYLNHYYLVSLLSGLMAVLPVGATWSLDARRRSARLGVGESARRSRFVPRWAYLVLMVQIGLVYVHAGLAKLNSDWLLRGEPVHGWLMALSEYPWLRSIAESRYSAYGMSWSGAILDLSMPFLLSWRRSRAYAYLFALGFHMMIALLFPVGMFSWIMLAAITVFAPPSWPRRFVKPLSRNLQRLRPLGSAKEPSHAPRRGVADVPPRGTRWVKLGLAAHLVAQSLIPLRFVLYPGDVNWTEVGFRFAWRIMLIEKTGAVEFEVETRDGRIFSVSPRQELTALQLRMMSTQPDMIRQYARHLAARFAKRGDVGVKVRARASASLNGRPTQLLIHPDVDLAAIGRAEEGTEWIVPLHL